MHQQMQKQETSTWKQTPVCNLFLDLESIGNKGEQGSKNVIPTRYCNPAEKYLLQKQYKLQTKQNPDIVWFLSLKNDQNLMLSCKCIFCINPKTWTGGGWKILRKMFHLELQTKSWCLINFFCRNFKLCPNHHVALSFDLLEWTQRSITFQEQSKLKKI